MKQPLVPKLPRSQIEFGNEQETTLLADEERRDLFEVMEDRYDRASTLIAAYFGTNRPPNLVVREQPVLFYKSESGRERFCPKEEIPVML